jgi:hypothetical protein
MLAFKFASLISGMVGRRAPLRGSPSAPAAADLLDSIADRWRCWRLRSETTDQHRHRLQVHLHTLAVAIEGDLALLDQFDRRPSTATENTYAR